MNTAAPEASGAARSRWTDCHRPSVARRVLLAMLAACAMGWGAIYLTGRLGVNAPGSGNFDREARITAGAAAQLADTHADPRELARALEGLTASIAWTQQIEDSPPGLVAFRVVEADGRVIASGGAAPPDWPAGDAPLGFVAHDSAGGGYRVLRAVAPGSGRRVEVASSEQAREQLFNDVMISPLAVRPLFYVVPMLLFLVWFAVGRGLKPLRELAAELRERRPDDLSPLKVQGVYRELSPVIAELNAAFARLRTLIERERGFLADAAHELRTPLAVMVAQCDSLHSATTEAARAAALTRLDSGVARASRLVNQLLSIARLDAAVEAEPVTIDLADLARDCLAMHAALAHAHSIELSYAGPDSLPRRCPRDCFESIVDNLVANAVRYGGPGVRIELALDVLPGGQVQLRVRDDGPGIPAEDMPRLFERFRRGANASASGSGLGLAIVRSAARRLAARVEVSAGIDGRGVEFRLAWPAG
ncbi:ATP-binding protein [Derxia gummosa]|uniref:histidine kinase n=1 Tax=Derxia gummosa DSM 723 TaxID=1121388 RepID=A0A8B6X8V1_9BURK|nr:ATP-binding protein [Derxia gummosa]